MKNKGVSLIVLVITVVVIIILGTAIIVNLAKTNIIGNANESTVKQDFKTFQEELNLYAANEYVKTKGEFKLSTFNADKTTIPSIYEVLTSLEKTKYKNDVTITNGKITLSDSLDLQIVEWIKEIISVNVTNLLPDEEETTNSVVTSEDITKNPAEYYGKEVEYVIDNPNVVASNSLMVAEQYDNTKWKIFYADNRNVYLIASQTLKLNGQEVIKFFENSNEAFSYVNNKANWTSFVNEQAEYAVGGPTIEMLVNSYNAKSTDFKLFIIGNDSAGWGFDEDEMISFSGYKDDLVLNSEYYYTISKSNREGAFPIVICGDTIVTDVVQYTGSTNIYAGFRPVVCLKRNTRLQMLGDTFKVVASENPTVNGEEISYKNPKIPNGFEAMETADATWEDYDNDGCPDGWNNGLVIKDGVGNEFVWVPVDNNIVQYNDEVYVKTEKFEISSSKQEATNDTLPNGITSEESQIVKYGGFYIARYEAGVPDKNSEPQNTTGKPVSKSNTVVWTDIDYINAKSSAESMYNNQYLKSGLVTPKAGLTASKWITSIYGDREGVSLLNEPDCQKFGNYSNSVEPANIKGYGEKQKTGYSDYWKINNIYDFYGNVEEKTNYVDDYYSYSRGGSYSQYADVGEILQNCFAGYVKETPRNDVGFRVMLYMQ